MNGLDWFAAAFGAALDDIRKRTVEEPWFGRAVTPPLRPDHTVSDALGWTQHDTFNDRTHGVNPDQQQQDHTHER